MFKDRSDAGRHLAEKLAHYRGQNAVVLALPRGGVVAGREIAQALGLPLDIAVVRKIGHPLSPEYAIGAVDDTGAIILNDAETESVSQAWLSDEIEREKKEADEVITLEPPEEFLGAVGAHYIEFEQVEDAEVIRLLSEGIR